MALADLRRKISGGTEWKQAKVYCYVVATVKNQDGHSSGLEDPKMAEVSHMPKHYVYRMRRDSGFAPNVDYRRCSLCGCKSKNIEKWANSGSWVIGLGGKGTGMPNKIIYAMSVESTPTYRQFKDSHPRKSEYLRVWARKTGRQSFLHRNPRVLLSTKYYYFGDNAIDLPWWLLRKIQQNGWTGRNCKCVSGEDAARLAKCLEARYDYGKHGAPNNRGLRNRGSRKRKWCTGCE